jgi:hypothetical protein
MRRYDSLGGVLSERTSMPEGWQAVLREVTRSHDYRRGISSIAIDTGRDTPPFWNRKTFHADGQGRVRRMSLDKEMAFAEYEYIGLQPVARRVSESGLEQSTDLTPFLEVQSERWLRIGAPQAQPFAAFNYYYDYFGDMEAHDLQIPSQEYSATHLHRYDPFQRPARQGVLRRTFENRKDRMQYLDDDPKFALPLESTRISRMEYDAAGNRIHQYNTRDREAGQHFSPAKPFYFPDMESGLREAREEPEMASDRLGSVASGNRLQQEYDYDAFGCMTTFPSKRDNQKLVWQVEYDILGRVTQMTGWEAEDSKRERAAITLEFATDAFNRRVMKYVLESDGGGGQKTHWAFTTYEENGTYLSTF